MPCTSRSIYALSLLAVDTLSPSHFLVCDLIIPRGGVLRIYVPQIYLLVISKKNGRWAVHVSTCKNDIYWLFSNSNSVSRIWMTNQLFGTYQHYCCIACLSLQHRQFFLSTSLDTLSTSSSTMTRKASNMWRTFRSYATPFCLWSLCRKHIFSCISINMEMYRYNGEAFEQLLLESPDIARYVRKLEIYIEPLSDNHFPVSHLTRLQSLIILYSGTCIRQKWGELPSSTQCSLMNLMYLPTLTHLDVECISDFPISNLIVCTNIKHLFLRHVDIIDDEATPLPLCRKSIKLQTLHISIPPRPIFQDIFKKIQQLRDLSLRINGM